MHFEKDHVYHVYNRGNNKTRIFFSPENYLFLLKKISKEWQQYCDLFCYCLMPNHFHFMLSPNEEGCQNIFLKGQPSHLQLLSKTIGKTLSSYTQAINLRNNTVGNLFQKKTKAKCITETQYHLFNRSATDYLINCFLYIHNNPLDAMIVKDLKEWPYSSWPDYYGFRNGSLCNRNLAMERIGLSLNDFNPLIKVEPEIEIIEGIW
jgi:putative transposase